MGTAGAIPGTPEGSVSAPLVKRAMVIIHGAGNWPIDYTKPMVQAIQGFLTMPETKQFDRIEVNYSDVITSAAAQMARATLGASSNNMMNMMINEHLQAATNTLAPEQLLSKLISAAPQIIGLGAAALLPGSDATLNAWALIVSGKSLTQLRNEIVEGISPTIQDVCLYLYAAAFEKMMRQKLIDKLHEAQQYDEVILVSHSLGTVIAFDVLNAWTEPKPNIPVWFTMGCPLAKVLRLDPGRQPRLVNPNVDRWYNVYNTHDLVADLLGPTFSKPGYSVFDVFVDVKDPTKTDPVSAHDYFTNANALKLVADALEIF